MTATCDIVAEYRQLVIDYHRLDDADPDYRAKCDVVIEQMERLWAAMTRDEKARANR